MPTIKAIIADDHPLFRVALKQAILAALDEHSLLEAENFGQLKSLLEQHPALELVFLDLHMPGNDGFTGLTLLQNHFPDVTIVMVSSDDQPEVMRRAIDLGASGFIPKSTQLPEIEQAIKQILQGETWLPTGISGYENQSSQYRALAAQLNQLTPQQYEVLARIADGQLNKQIAWDLSIQETTVKKHVSAILQKLEVNNRTQAGLVYQQLKLGPLAQSA